MQDEIMVSVICITYNHEHYIRKALESIVEQKTDFPFEIIVHDDASTDRTADIIREFETRRPDLIRAIYQSNNMHSQEIPIFQNFIYPIARGKYIATCEGDDYWCDENKLQKQVDFLEAHPDYASCVHRAIFVHTDDPSKDFIKPAPAESRTYTTEEIIMGDGNMFSTNSQLRRAQCVFNKPPCFKAKGFGDYQSFIFSSICGKVYCMSDVMSVYNVGLPGSWTQRVWNDPQKRADHLREKIRMLRAVDEYYEHRYHPAIDKKITETEYHILETEKNKKGMRQKKYRSLYKSDRKRKFKSSLKQVFPWIPKLKQKITKV